MNRKNMHVIEGNLVADPKLTTFTKQDNNGKSREVNVVNFTIAANGGRDGHSNEVFFARCEAFDSGAERIAEYRKGDCLHIEAIGRNKEWKGKDGETKRDVVFRVTHFIEVSLKSDYNENFDSNSNSNSNTEVVVN